MSKHLLQIDISKSKYNKKKNDVIELRIENHEVLEVSFSKLVSQSKYIRDKYNYSEASNILPKELEEKIQENKISFESLKHFIELIEEERISIPVEQIQNMYILSEYFDTLTIIEELDKMYQENLFKDLNFTIQALQDYEGMECNDQIKIASKTEEYLSTRINECIINSKFGELQIATISRILKKCGKEKIDHNLLVDFILKSIETRFVIFIFVEINQLSEDKSEEFFNILDKQEKEAKEKYLEYLPFSLSFYKKMKNKYDKLLKENEYKKEEHEKTKEELKRMKIQLKQTEEEYEKTKEELKQAKQELIKAKIKLEKKQNLPSIVTAGGYNAFNQLGKSSDKTNGCMKFQLDSYPLLSFSCYFEHSVLITIGRTLKVIGYNYDYRIRADSIENRIIDHFTDICIKDDSGKRLDPISAVCYDRGILYIVSKMNEYKRQLVLSDRDTNDGYPFFLDIGNHCPVSLFGGYHHSAAIDIEGEVIFINRNSVQKSPKSRINSVQLPDREKASSVACCDDSVAVLSLNGRVFSSPVDDQSVVNFSEVMELSGIEIVCISGTFKHILAVSKEGRVFGRGMNDCGQLGLDKSIKSVPSFTEILSLRECKIRAAYAGCNHSLFETKEGKILSCGNNSHGELLLSSGSSGPVYSPTETTITCAATFCIAGYHHSTVFIGNYPPQNTPNKRIDEFSCFI